MKDYCCVTQKNALKKYIYSLNTIIEYNKPSMPFNKDFKVI